MFTTKEAKVVFLNSRVGETTACASFDTFSEELHKGASQWLDFQTKARQSDLNMAALRDAYLHGLVEYIKINCCHIPPLAAGASQTP